MILSIIAALDAQGGIGFQNQIPWHLPRDLVRFKNITMGHHLILGRKTYQSIGKPLPGRQMIVLTRNPEYRLEGSRLASSFEEALVMARKEGECEAFVIGGAEIYRLALPLADRMYLTHVSTVSQADVYFPAYSSDDWIEICKQGFPLDPDNPFPTTFQFFVRKISL